MVETLSCLTINRLEFSSFAEFNLFTQLNVRLSFINTEYGRTRIFRRLSLVSLSSRGEVYLSRSTCVKRMPIVRLTQRGNCFFFLPDGYCLSGTLVGSNVIAGARSLALLTSRSMIYLVRFAFLSHASSFPLPHQSRSRTSQGTLSQNAKRKKLNQPWFFNI